MAVKKRWHITLSTTESLKPINLSLSKKMGMSIFALSILIIILFAGSITYISYNHNKISQAQSILTEYNQLKERLFTLSNQIDSVMTRLRLMEEWEDKIRSDENFKIINKEIREMGVGGLPRIDSTFITNDDELNLEYNTTLNKIIKLTSKANFNYETHEELLDKIQLKKLLYLNTPSIYPTYGRISDPFGWRTHPITGKRSFHYGLDFGNARGTPVYATADGKIRTVGRQKYFGRYIAISHQFGYQTNFAHLSKIFVKEGDTVKRGQIIAEVGNTGRSTGAHLHYEVLRYNKYRNPYKYLNKLEDDIILTNK